LINYSTIHQAEEEWLAFIEEKLGLTTNLFDRIGFVDILELEGTTAYPKAVIPNAKSLSAAVYGSEGFLQSPLELPWT
jgi:hypothetical protein